MNGRLYRSTTDRMISGVAGGLADYLNLDPSLVRIIWAVLMVVTGGLFFLVYIVMWIVVPEGPGRVRAPWRDVTPPPPGGPAAAAGAATDPVTGAPLDDPLAGDPMAADPMATEPRFFGTPRHEGSGNGRLVFGLVLIGLGAYFLLRNYIPVIAWDRFWPVLLVLAGVALLIATTRRHPHQ
jgi:phage shock protein PspC (stress-responsive transcriptional regulator)